MRITLLSSGTASASLRSAHISPAGRRIGIVGIGKAGTTSNDLLILCRSKSHRRW
jgi:hypothetical protein